MHGCKGRSFGLDGIVRPRENAAHVFAETTRTLKGVRAMERVQKRGGMLGIAIAGVVVGLVFGWLAAGGGHVTRALASGGGDRSGESIVATGPLSIRYNEGLKIQVPQEAVYFLDYRGARLLATAPSPQQTVGGSRFIDGFAERDLIADFKLEPDPDTAPRYHFIMTAGSIGSLSNGWAPLYVFETTTKQVAVYKFEPQISGGASRPRFEVLEVRSFAKAEAAGN